MEVPIADCFGGVPWVLILGMNYK